MWVLAFDARRIPCGPAMLPQSRSERLTTSRDSTQRELNPHTLHGKQEGFRYIMGASSTLQIANHKSPLGSLGFEPRPSQIKSLERCRLRHDPARNPALKSWLRL